VTSEPALSAEERVQHYQDQLGECETELLIKNIEINNQCVKIRDLTLKVESLEQSLAAQEGEIITLRQFKEGKKVLYRNSLNDLQGKLLEKEKELQELQEKLKEIKPLKTLNTKQKRVISNLQTTNDKLLREKTTLTRNHPSALQGKKSTTETIAQLDYSYNIPVVVNKFTSLAANNNKYESDNYHTLTETRPRKPHQPPVKPKYAEVLIVGDNSVRGLGPLIQDNCISGSVSVRGGADINAMLHDIQSDANTVKASDASRRLLITSYGRSDLDNGRGSIPRKDLQMMVNALANTQQDIQTAVMAIPPRMTANRMEYAVTEANEYLQKLCKDVGIHFLDSKLGHRDIGRNDLLNDMGRSKTATAVKYFKKGF
jgi:hypothetical protein